MGCSHPRGIFRQHYEAPGGGEVLVAIDRNGECLAQVAVTERAERDQIIRSLRRLLRRADPPPIRLLR